MQLSGNRDATLVVLSGRLPRLAFWPFWPFWLPRSSVGADGNASALRPPTGRWSVQTAFPRWSVGTRAGYEIACRLDSLGEDVRDRFGSTWLLSAREPTDTLIARAGRARIRLVRPTELQDLRRLVREWRGRARMFITQGCKLAGPAFFRDLRQDRSVS